MVKLIKEVLAAFESLDCAANTDSCICDANKQRGLETCMKCDIAEASKTLRDFISNYVEIEPRKGLALEGEFAKIIKEKGMQNYEVLRCANCNHIVEKGSVKKTIMNYCPNCGQKQEKGKK